MRVKEISFSIMCNNIKKNYKIMFIIMSICILIGIFAGLASAYSYDGERKIYANQVEEHIDLANIQQNEEYYYNSFFTLKEKNDYLNAYIRYFEQVTLSNESRIALEKVCDDLEEYQNDFEDAKEFFYINAPTFVDKIDLTINFYSREKKELIKIRDEKECELERIVEGKYTDEYKQSRQLTLTEDVTKIQKNIDMFSRHIDILNNTNYSVVKKNSKEADVVLKENYEKINEIIDEFNCTMKLIAEKENYEIIYNKRLLSEYAEVAGFNNELEQEEVLKNKKNKAIIYAQSIAGLDQKKERFLATLTFFMLFGLVISVVVGATYISKKENKK